MQSLGNLFQAAGELQAFCKSHRWKFCFIGGIAVQRWAEPRFTLDADITLLTGFGNEEYFIDLLLGKFAGRRKDARAFSIKARVLLLQSSTGIPLDVALGAVPFEEHCVKRSSAFDFGSGIRLTTCSAEDLIVHKCFAGRGQDWVDVSKILMHQYGRLDLALIRRELKPLLKAKEQTETSKKLEMEIDRVKSLHRGD